MKTKKKANQVKRYYSVTFNDNTETAVTKGCITTATPIMLNEYEGKKGQETLVAQYDLTKAKMNEYRINGDTPLTQEKALTKAELVKLYEEYHSMKWDEYNNRLNVWIKNKHFRLITILLSNQRPLFTRGFIEKSIRESENNEPKWTEPTFNEFMEWLEKKGKPAPKYEYTNIFPNLSFKVSDFMGGVNLRCK